MTFIDEGDSSPVSQYMSGTLHFIAPFYWKTSSVAMGATNSDVPVTWCSLKTIGSENVNAIAYSMYRPISIGFDEYDWFDTNSRLAPYTGNSWNNFLQMNVSGGVNTIYRNIISDKYFKEGVTVGKTIDVTWGFHTTTYISSRRFRFIASLIDTSGNKTPIGISGWADISIGVDSTSTCYVSSGGVDVVGTDKRLFIELQYELTHAANTNTETQYIYNGSISSTSKFVTGPFISCSVE